MIKFHRRSCLPQMQLYLLASCASAVPFLGLGSRSAPSISPINSNGCVATAGFSFCPTIKQCIKPFEDTCPPAKGVKGGKDGFGCKTDDGELFCPSSNKCFVTFEEDCAMPDEDIVVTIEQNTITTVVGDHGCIKSKGYSFCEALNRCTLSDGCPFNSNLTKRFLGGDKDQHGCIKAAGYSFCVSLNTCVRPFDTYCPSALGGDKDGFGCISSAGYSFCAPMNKCIRPFETECPLLELIKRNEENPLKKRDDERYEDRDDRTEFHHHGRQNKDFYQPQNQGPTGGRQW